VLEKRELERVNKLYVEWKNLKDRILKIEDKSTRDSVRASSKNFPYIQHTAVIEGISESKKKKRYKALLKKKEAELDKTLLHIEYELNYIEDPELRDIIRFKYMDGMTNYQVANKLNDNHNTYKYNEDNIRMKINRFFEKKS